jgi:Putative DNA-binding domain
MIPKPLNEIEWSDIEALRDSGREEDDTIEYKASFSGGSDYLNFTDSQREKAIIGIAREVIAFLNARGGDLIIGAEEEKNENPKIKALMPMSAVTSIAERLFQSLSSVIEPYQSVLGVRAVRDGSDDTGVILVRAPQSLRAPHRLTKNKECYVRRGRESVPMPMDEIQDIAVRRNLTRQERLQELAYYFDGLSEGRVRRETITGCRFHARIAFLPFARNTVDIAEVILNEVVSRPPRLSDGHGQVVIEDVFFRLNRIWRPVLRGKAQISLYDDGAFIELIRREFRIGGSAIYDAAWRHPHNNQGSEVHDIVPIRWMVDFIASALWEIRAFASKFPTSLPGLLELRTFASTPIKFGMDRNGRDLVALLQGLTIMAPFEINGVDDFDMALTQMQNDLYSLVERSPPYLLAFDDGI